MAKQAKIITVFNEKGGSGKTTTSCQLAGTLGRHGFDVLVADLDSQQTASQWLSAGEGLNFKATLWPGFRYGSNVSGELKKMAQKYDVVVADCAPSVEQPTTWSVLLVSDLILIPTKLSPPDIVALASAKRLAKKAAVTALRTIPTFTVPTSARLHINDDKEFYAALLEDLEIPPLAVLGDRKAFSRSMLYGSTVHDIKGTDAVREIEELTEKVEALLGLAITE